MGILLSLFSASLLVPAGVSYLTSDGNELPFLFAFIVTIATGLGFWFATRKSREDLRIRDGFIIVVLFFEVGSYQVAKPVKISNPFILC